MTGVRVREVARRSSGRTAGPDPVAAAGVRLATEEEGPAIWPSLREVIAAGQPLTHDGHVDEPGARALWMGGTPGVVAAARALRRYAWLAMTVVGTVPDGFRPSDSRPGEAAPAARAALPSSFMITADPPGGSRFR